MNITLSRDEYLSLLNYKVRVEVCLQLYAKGKRHEAVDALADLFEIEVEE